MCLSSLVAALSYCRRVHAFSHGKALHCHVIKLGVIADVFISNNLISLYAKSPRFINDAYAMFDEIPHRNIITWTTMLNLVECLAVTEGVVSPAVAEGGDEAAQAHSVTTSRKLLNMLHARKTVTMVDLFFLKIKRNGFMYSAVLKACAAVGDVAVGRVHERVCDEGLGFYVVLMKGVLGRMEEGNAALWNTVVAGFMSHGMGRRAVEFVRLIHCAGFALDCYTVPCGLKACVFCGLLEFGEQLHCYVVKSGFEADSFALSTLVDMYANLNELDAAVKLFDQYSRCRSSVNLVLWNSMISGCVANEHNSVALDLVAKVHSSGAWMDFYTYSGALKACVNLLNLRLGRQVHGLVVGSILIDLYARVGNIKDALALFHRLPGKDSVAWSGLIIGCAKVGLSQLAFRLLRDMVYLGVEVDHFVISYVLKVCSGLTSLESGKQVHAFSVKRGYESEAFVVTSLIDVYSKCGDIADSLAVFDSLADRDTVCWTGIIVGCAQNGRADESIRLFNMMRESGLKPNDVTYLGVLSACRHAGYAEKARTIFSSMEKECGLEPRLEHYHCMTDILSQAGCFEEALDFISKLPFEPDQFIWRSLLGACGTHKNTELVNIVADRLIASSPEDPSTYVALSNVYAELGMWVELSKVRSAVRQVGAKSEGKSWIAVSG